MRTIHGVLCTSLLIRSARKIFSARSAAASLVAFGDGLDLAWQRYLETGGFGFTSARRARLALIDATQRPADLTRSTEAALGLALARSVAALHPERFLEQRAVMYVRTGSGGEVDFAPMTVSIGSNQAATCPLESKWVPDGWRGEARTIGAKYGRGVVATKSVTDLTGDVWAMPAPVVALLLHPSSM